jgi:hypothetical protein
MTTKAAVITGDHPPAPQEESMAKITAANLSSWAGLSAMVAGILFVVIQPLHPPDTLTSVTTSTWTIIHSLTIAMSVLGLIGIAGIYARQVEKVGWLGLAGYVAFSLFLLVTFAWTFAEAFISPVLATEAPTFVEGFLGIVSGHPSEINLGALPTLYLSAGAFVLLGCLVFGIATLRAGILSRWAAGLLAFGGPASAVVVSLLPHEYERYAALPIGIGLAWLGYSLWSERREDASERTPRTAVATKPAAA